MLSVLFFISGIVCAQKQTKPVRKNASGQKTEAASSGQLSNTTVAAVQAKAESFYAAAINQVNSKHVAWIKENAQKISRKKLNEISIRVVTNFYGKNEGLDSAAIDGLMVLLLRETYVLEEKKFDESRKNAEDIKDSKMSLHDAYELLSDSNHIVSGNELDSINLLIDNAESLLNDSAANKTEDKEVETHSLSRNNNRSNTGALSDLSSTQKKLANKITALIESQNHYESQMQEITDQKQRITMILFKMVDQVTEKQDTIIKGLQ